MIAFVLVCVGGGVFGLYSQTLSGSWQMAVHNKPADSVKAYFL